MAPPEDLQKKKEDPPKDDPSEEKMEDDNEEGEIPGEESSEKKKSDRRHSTSSTSSAEVAVSMTSVNCTGTSSKQLLDDVPEETRHFSQKSVLPSVGNEPENSGKNSNVTSLIPEARRDHDVIFHVTFGEETTLKNTLASAEKCVGKCDIAPHRSKIKATPMEKHIAPLVYEAPSMCDKGITIPDLYRIGKVPEIRVSGTDGQLEDERDTLTSTPKDEKLLSAPSVVLCPNETLPLKYKVVCVCDSDSDGTDCSSASDMLSKQNFAIPSDKELLDPNCWPRGTPSNEGAWDDLPVEQKSSEKLANESDNPVGESTCVDSMTLSALKTLDPVTQLRIPNRAAGNKVPPVPTMGKQGKQPVAKGGASSRSGPKLGNGKAPANNIANYFQRKIVAPKATTSADSTVTLCPEKSNISFASKVSGKCYNSDEYLSNSTVTHTIISSPKSRSKLNLGESTLDKLDDFDLPVTRSCPNISNDSALPSTLENLRALEDSTVDGDEALPSISVPLPRLRQKPKKRKRRRMNDGGPNSSSSSDDAIPSNTNSLGNNNDPVTIDDPHSVYLQENGEGDLTEEGIKEILDRNIVVPQSAADSFRRTRGAMVAEAKGQVRSKHLRAMSEANRLPRWALGLESAPAYAPSSREMHEEFVEMVRRQARERMNLMARHLEAKAKYFKNIAQAGLKGIKHLYGNDKKDYDDCRSLLKALASKDKIQVRKNVQKTEVAVGKDPVSEDEIVRELLAPQVQQDNQTSRPLAFRSKPAKGKTEGKNQPTSPRDADLRESRSTASVASAGEGTSTGGVTPFGANAVGAKGGWRDQQKGKKRGPDTYKRYPRGNSGRRWASRSRSPPPKRRSPGTPDQRKSRKDWKKDGRKDNQPKDRRQPKENQDFQEGRPSTSRRSPGRLGRGQRPQEQRRHPQEEMFLQAIQRALDEMAREDPTWPRPKPKKEE